MKLADPVHRHVPRCQPRIPSRLRRQPGRVGMRGAVVDDGIAIPVRRSGGRELSAKRSTTGALTQMSFWTTDAAGRTTSSPDPNPARVLEMPRAPSSDTSAARAGRGRKGRSPARRRSVRIPLHLEYPWRRGWSHMTAVIRRRDPYPRIALVAPLSQLTQLALRRNHHSDELFRAGRLERLAVEYDESRPSRFARCPVCPNGS